MPASTPATTGQPHCVIGVSTKMYLGYQASLVWLTAVRAVVTARGPLPAALTVFVAPAFPVLESASRILAGSGVVLGAQNCSTAAGALTGEVSAALLAEVGVELVEIGHAERRRRFGETDAVVAAKTAAAVLAGLTPLLCVGEAVRGTPTATARFCYEQITAALGGSVYLDSVMVAYEPVWAIGAAAPAEPDYVNDVVARLRELLRPLASAGGPQIIYGGSATVGLLPRLDAVDGLFLGRFAHDPAAFGRILDEAILRVSR
jgi:triosephosphate isomerase